MVRNRYNYAVNQILLRMNITGSASKPSYIIVKGGVVDSHTICQGFET